MCPGLLLALLLQKLWGAPSVAARRLPFALAMDITLGDTAIPPPPREIRFCYTLDTPQQVSKLSTSQVGRRQGRDCQASRSEVSPHFFYFPFGVPGPWVFPWHFTHAQQQQHCCSNQRRTRPTAARKPNQLALRSRGSYRQA